jgi:hypothetical protein
MMVIRCDLHTRYQQIAMLDMSTGEQVEQSLEHELGHSDSATRTNFRVPENIHRGHVTSNLPSTTSNQR